MVAAFDHLLKLQDIQYNVLCFPSIALQ
jgi:hypothetical protein